MAYCISVRVICESLHKRLTFATKRSRANLCLYLTSGFFLQTFAFNSGWKVLLLCWHACVCSGTHGYMAPEVLAKGVAYDSSADWFSFGCMLYKLLRGSVSDLTHFSHLWLVLSLVAHLHTRLVSFLINIPEIVVGFDNYKFQTAESSGWQKFVGDCKIGKKLWISNTLGPLIAISALNYIALDWLH